MRDLDEAELKWHRQQLKEARRAGLSDLENAHQLVVAIESLGKRLRNNSRATLGEVKCCLVAFANKCDRDGEMGDPNASPLGVMLERVKDQRNDYAHEGTAARRLARQAAEVAIRLERALLNAEKKERPMEMRDVMTSPVICAEDWQTLAHVRRVMLLHEFSILPYRAKDKRANGQLKWKFIEAGHVVKAMAKDGKNGNKALSKAEKKRRLGMTVKEAFKDKILTCKPAETAKTCAEVEISELDLVTTLVITDAGEAAGIVTPFDLL